MALNCRRTVRYRSEPLFDYQKSNAVHPVKSFDLVAPPGLEPGLSALKGPRVNQLHHGAKHTINPTTQLYAVCFEETEEEKIW